MKLLCFFFSSRRRHTRCSRDWSSDVCSSDLRQGDTPGLGKDDGRERADASQPETARCLALAGIDRLDRRAIDLRHVGAVEQCQRHHARWDRIEVEADRRGDAEVDEQDVDIERKSAEDLDVKEADQADRARHHADQGDNQPKNERERHRQERDTDRDQQAALQESRGSRDDAPVIRIGEPESSHAIRSLRSSRYTRAEKNSTSTTRIPATAAKTSKGVKSVTLSSLARKTMSGTAITAMIVAPFNNPTNVLPSGGTTIRNAWGRTTCP